MSDWIDVVAHCRLIQTKPFSASDDAHDVLDVVKVRWRYLRSLAHPKIDRTAVKFLDRKRARRRHCEIMPC